MTAQLLASDHEYLVDLIQSRTGLVLNPHQIDELKRRVTHAMADHNLPELKQFLAVFPFTHPLWQDFIQNLTIGETYFYRNSSHFNALRNEILTPLIAQRRKNGFRQLRIWSAGCATGEEPYSLAILLHELIPDIDHWSITLLASDINSGFLDYARDGLYGKRSFRGETPDWIQARWFRLESGKYRVDPRIRKMVMFRMLNLVSDEFPTTESYTTNMDLILCRNVTIYFDADTTRKVMGKFHRVLNTDGWLVVGHSEPNSELYREFKARNLQNTVVYQKPEAPSTAPLVKSAPTNKKKPSTPKAVPASRPSAIKPKLQPVVKTPPVHVPVREEEMDQWEAARRAADRERWDEALRLLQQVEEKDVLQPHVHYLRGIIHSQIGNVDSAVMALRQAIYCDSNFALAHFSLGELYFKQRFYKEAARHFKQAKRTIAGLPDGYSFPYDEDLTVEMLNGLLAYHIERLPASMKE